MPKKLTFESASKKISNKFKYLTLLKFSGRTKDATFLDSDYGEFVGNYEYVFYEKKRHPNRVSTKRKKSSAKALEKRKKTCLEKYGVESAFQSEDVKDKIKQTNLKKYGTEYAISSNEVKEQIRKTNLDKYGVENVLKCKEIQNNIKKTNLEKYGIDNLFKSKDIQDIIKETNLEKYGYENVFQNEEIKEKVRKTNLDKYGVENPQQNKEIRERTKNTNLERYGFESSIKNIKIKEKVRETNLKRYGVENPVQNTEIQKKIKQTNLLSGKWYNINGLSASEFYRVNDIDSSISVFIKNIKDVGTENALLFKSNKTNIENIISLCLNKHLIKYIFNRCLSNMKIRPDFLIDNNNLIIECDGLYYHSDGYGSSEKIRNNKKFHKERQEKYKELGYRSLFFREDEILNKTPIVESIILSKLGLISNRIFARKTKIINLDSKKAAAFFEENHLMGKGSGQCYALTYEDKIVSAIRIIKKKDYIDISRFCSALNTNVVGGLGKLMKHIIREHNPQKIVSFVDMRYGDGHSLEKLGFVEKTNHVSFKWTDFKNTYHRQNFLGSSGYEKGMFKIWDCGQKKFEF